MDQAALETALQVTSLISAVYLIDFNWMKLLLMGHADLALPEYSSIFEKCSLQDFIVNLAGMEFGAGGHPGLQVIITYKM